MRRLAHALPFLLLLILASCGARPTYLVIAVSSAPTLAALTSLRAIVVHNGEQASVELRAGTFDVGDPISFALEIEAARRGAATIEVTALRASTEVARVRVDVTLTGRTERYTVQLASLAPPDDGGTVSCGARNQPCCDGTSCNAALVCDGGLCRCGGPGQPCCDATEGAVCGANLACNGELCECGGVDQPCCNGSACIAGNACEAGTTLCRACGGVGQPCCGTTCNANLACDGTAHCACGGDGQPCCDGASCGQGFACASGICASCLPACAGCGGENQPCCVGGTCSTGFTCDGVNCLACGGRGQMCCTGNLCDPSLQCRAGGLCGCGGKDEPCCADGTMSCGENLTCKSGVCKCGSKAQPCCDGKTCNSNSLQCTNGTCQCGGLGEVCCNDNSCNTGLGCVDNKCAAFGGVSEGEDIFMASCLPCHYPNPKTTTCGCPTGLTNYSLRVLTDCRGADTFHGANLGICASAVLKNGADFGGFYAQDDTMCRSGDMCPIKNPYTNACTCPAGYVGITTQQIVDVSYSCSSFGYVGTDITFCYLPTAPIVSFGGVYQKDIENCSAIPTKCRVANPLAGNTCDCPASAAQKIEIPMLVDCNLNKRVPSTLVFCMP